jgi:hypothetical protein
MNPTSDRSFMRAQAKALLGGLVTVAAIVLVIVIAGSDEFLEGSSARNAARWFRRS